VGSENGSSEPFLASQTPFHRKYLKNGKSQHYMAREWIVQPLTLLFRKVV